MHNRRLAGFACALAIIATPAAATDVRLSGQVFVERRVEDPRGERTIIEERAQLRRGDQVIFVVGWHNRGPRPARDVVLVNPLPRAIAFQSAGKSGASVSIDGGRSWGALERLVVRDEDGGLRGARPEDVTHVRWRLAQAVPAGATGRVSFRGVVR